ncbi:stage III sporulation protein AB [Pseudoflavonifractor sp. MSJ-30]|uniref:stage III sporulation protein AB n=1 Tax=Pseudoflavonifractor sp. MSJ-30 TaxID=2841525 RepID=UPI001C0F7C18|nr:stage III sporulation protein AB [Pseudoflavonifractor sp. MSJ-30]MBU5453749.1 stage III sporulation protein AB [Pseudoflavonifractor sp. MSJ-30]
MEEYKWIGAVLVIGGCGGFGFSVAREAIRQERLLRQLLENLDFMESELRYRLTPLPELFQLCALRSNGCLKRLFLDMSGELDKHTEPQVEVCLRNALDANPAIPGRIRRRIYQLGRNLGRFNLEGQLQGIESAREGCRRELRELERNRQERLRGYRTLGLCAGAALAVLLF